MNAIIEELDGHDRCEFEEWLISLRKIEPLGGFEECLGVDPAEGERCRPSTGQLDLRRVWEAAE